MGNKVMNGEGIMIDWETVVNLMDDDIREAVHADIAPCENQEFYNEYCKRHLEKYGAAFVPDIVGGQW